MVGREDLPIYRSQIEDFTVSLDGKELLAACSDGAIRVYGISSGLLKHRLHTVDTYNNLAQIIEIPENGRGAEWQSSLVVSNDYDIWVYAYPSLELVLKKRSCPGRHIFHLPGTSILLFIDRDKIRWVNLRTGDQTRELSIGANDITAACMLSSTGSEATLVLGSSDGNLHYVDTEMEKETVTLLDVQPGAGTAVTAIESIKSNGVVAGLATGELFQVEWEGFTGFIQSKHTTRREIRKLVVSGDRIGVAMIGRVEIRRGGKLGEVLVGKNILHAPMDIAILHRSLNGDWDRDQLVVANNSVVDQRQALVFYSLPEPGDTNNTIDEGFKVDVLGNWQRVVETRRGFLLGGHGNIVLTGHNSSIPNAEDAKKSFTIPSGYNVRSLAVSSNGKYVACGIWQKAYILNAQDLSPVAEVPSPHWVKEIAFHPSREEIFLHVSSTGVEQRRISDQSLVNRFEGDCRTFALNDDGSLIALTTGGGEIAVYSTISGQQQMLLSDPWEESHIRGIEVIRFLGTEKLITGNYNGLVQIWDLEKKTAKYLQAHSTVVQDIAVMPSLSLFVTVDFLGNLFFWDTETLIRVGQVALVPGPVSITSVDDNRITVSQSDYSMTTFSLDPEDSPASATAPSGTPLLMEAQGHFQQGEAYVAEKKYERAIAEYTKAIALNPEDAAFYRHRGIAYYILRDYKLAILDTTESLRLDPSQRDSFSLRSLAHLDSGNTSEAIRDCSRAIELDPQDAVSFYTRGRAYQQEQDIEMAIKDFSEAIRLNPNDAGPFNQRGWLYEATQDYNAAIADHTRAIGLEPNNADFYYGRGSSYSRKEDYDAAIKDYTKVIRLEPDFVAAYKSRGEAYLRKKDYAAAIQDVSEVIRLKPDDGKLYNQRAIWHIATRDYDASIADHTRAIRLEPNNAEFYFSRGQVYYLKGDKDNAIKDYTEAIRLKPDHALAYRRRGNAYRTKQDFAAAIQDITESIRLNPDDAYAYDGRGTAHLSQQNPLLAIQDYTKAIDIKPDLGLLYYHRARAYVLINDQGKARADFDKARALGYEP
jgi:tetratricopeptide (TPR) repeat protein